MISKILSKFNSFINKKRNKTIFLITTILSLTGILESHITYSYENNKNTFSNEESKLPAYKIGPGDKLIVELFKMKDYSSSITVLPDGTVNLPRLNSIYVSGLTIDQFRQLITDKYKKIFKQPLVYVDLLNTRPIKISVSGEVQRPGLYTINLSGTNNVSGADGSNSVVFSRSGWPTVLDAIQQAGGLSSQANLRDISLQRVDTNKPIIINLWDSLSGEGKIYNPPIYDGDSIRIEKAKIINKEELIIIASSNLSPANITVNVVGEIGRPGKINVRANTPISQALLAAGGLTRRANKNKIYLYRLMLNGSVKSSVYSYKPDLAIDESSNPPLRDKDVILVKSNNWSKFNDGLSDITKPIGPVINSVSVLKLLTD